MIFELQNTNTKTVLVLAKTIKVYISQMIIETLTCKMGANDIKLKNF
jgi:hypothetical protein